MDYALCISFLWLHKSYPQTVDWITFIISQYLALLWASGLAQVFLWLRVSHEAAVSKVPAGARVTGYIKPQLWEDLHPNLFPWPLQDRMKSLTDHTRQFLAKWAFLWGNLQHGIRLCHSEGSEENGARHAQDGS